jgi:hypothetical protein
MDIRQSNTLNRKLAREDDDERHICPLQLDLIERCMFLWSIPGDLVFSPFTGIGSEGYVATAMGRRFLGSELKRSYFELARTSLEQAPRSEYRFPHFQKAIGKWTPDGGAEPEKKVMARGSTPAGIERGSSEWIQMDWVSSLGRSATDQVSCGERA